MIEINMNKDVGSFEAKLIGPFTARQTICLVVAAPLCWFIYKYLSPHLSEDVAGFFMLLPAVGAWAFGWIKPYGMRTEKFIQSVFINMVLAPSNRKYKTENTHEKTFSVLAQHAEKLEAQERGSKVKKSTQRKTRYKVSSDAVR